jgi:hypothetical protein
MDFKVLIKLHYIEVLLEIFVMMPLSYIDLKDMKKNPTLKIKGHQIYV